MKARSIAAALILFSAVGLSALEVPPLSAPVTDLAELLTVEQADNLNRLLLDYEAATSNQFALLIVPSLEGEALEEYAIEVASAWELGQADKDNGLLLLVAFEERRLRIEVGYGLEGVLTDAFCGRVIDHTIVPYFKAGDYYEGITAGLLELIRQSGDEFSPDPALEPEAATGELTGRTGALVFLMVPFLMILVIAILLARSRVLSRLFKEKYENLGPAEARELGMDPALYKVWQKRTAKQLKGQTAALTFAGVIPILPSFAAIPMTRLALIVPGIHLFALLVAPLLFRARKLPYRLSYRKLADEYDKLQGLMQEVSSEEERKKMLELFLAGYVATALMRSVIQTKGHFDSEYFKSSYRSSSSSSGSRSSFGGGGG
ncbi:MAG: TPM domain-containing protein, partial [Spirochaetales bacterium]|nr:TPM domain-containing protein [Spirochaetales bacterium]